MTEKKHKDKLLVPVDFSPFSEEALHFAGKLADKLGAKLFVLHVIHDPLNAPGFYSGKGKRKKFLRSMEDAAEQMMDEFMAKMRKKHPQKASIQNASLALIVGIPVTRIVEFAAKKGAEMIIIGSHGRTGLSNLLLGSKAEQVVRLSTIPVTVVKVSKRPKK